MCGSDHSRSNTYPSLLCKSTGVQYVQVTYALVIAGTEDIDERLVVLFNKDLPFSSLMGQRVLLGVAETPHPRSILYTHHQLEARTGSHS